ncbi:FAD-dependent 5-carboxymethylaminomethyl-2-thiouridine(34) oxidoreductase MnmC [Acanthopleuribacter pedis]|uniref:FAD-dependent 5-carboxymethylaminomethyl-2-thiouridine(34) oxidoreductase MnmC n=1 Tax=Acanthopleuribacter pedis TaxID=442870 RepID=A0A8J7Q632_9BACT|nr:FAD-dependent 5-carboxymethylaminomethyl-2-thiouridine(34) oxidoreductase MnmC [Acanthopleuribacter pedis]MBO1318721.1 FAD-dependent 5-carboxymethylaminomethyl-2-thiouridine(34) oxidoreductase MnmC [Acanthopleuribacter pedis]
MRRRRDGNIADQPWFRQPSPVAARRVVVLGAGVAGAAAAFSLAEAGFEVRVLDRRPAPAMETSAHPGAVVMPIISQAPAPVSSYHCHAYAQTLARIALLEARGLDPGWHPTGVVHLLTKSRLRKLYDGLAETGYPDGLVQRGSAEQVAALTGLPAAQPGLVFPKAGWVDARAYVAAQLNHARITFVGDADIAEIEADSSGWRLLGRDGGCVAETPLLVLAAAADCVRFPLCDWFPLIRIRGQLAYVDPQSCGQDLRAVVCHDGYTIPHTDAGHLMGATFDYDRTDTALDRNDFENLVLRNRDLFAFRGEAADLPLAGRVAFRAKCHDHLPMVGAVPDYDAYMGAYGDITKGRAYVDYPDAPYVPGLYVTTGHGSRGMISSIAAAEILTAQLLGRPAPVTPGLLAAVHPARFIIRRLLRRQPSLREDGARRRGDATLNAWR